MSAELTHRPLSENADTLLAIIKEVAPSGHIGNIRLRTLLEDRGLNWSEDEYWKAANELRQENIIETGRGRGGGLWLKQESIQPLELPSKDLGIVDEESQLYKPLCEWLDKNWGREVRERDDFFLVKTTASPSGRRRETGPWSRPDISLVQVNSFDFYPASEIETQSFEVKTYEESDSLDNIYEAAAHGRWVHYSWLVVEDLRKSPKEFSERFKTELDRFRVGLMRMTRQDDGTYKISTELEALYQDPEPRDLDEFLKNFFTQEGGRPDDRNLRRFKEKSRR